MFRSAMLHSVPPSGRWCLRRQFMSMTRNLGPLRPQCSGKGFGNTTPKKPKEEDSPDLPSSKVKRVKPKGKMQRRMPQPSQPPPQPSVVQQGVSGFNAVADRPVAVVDELEFEERLKALKQEAELKKQELKATQPSQPQGILDTKRKGQEDIYANPPSLASTLLGKKEGADEYGGAQFGPGQVALAAVSIALVGVFVIANGSSDLSYMLSPSAAQQAQQGTPRAVELSDDTRAELERQLADFQGQLAASPDSTEALEGAAVINARLGNFKEAVEQLQQLTGAKPSDPDVWRVLAESQSALGDRKAAIASYQRAWQEVQAARATSGSLEVLQGLAGELMAAGKEQQAVELVKEARAVVVSQPEGGLGAVEVELLLGKVYSQWRGHMGDALAVYDALTQSQPEDFRGFLAKGLLLRDQGRQADAQRSFIQARYLAPRESRAVVDNIINRAR